MLIHTIQLKEFKPFTNNYEGTVNFIYLDRLFCAYTVMNGEEDWDTFQLNKQHNVVLELDCTEDFTILSSSATSIDQIEDSLYTVRGQLVARTRNYLLLQSDFLMYIHLGIPVSNPTFGQAIQVGHIVTITGVLQVEFDPTEDDEYILLEESMRG